jgi:hypothetical protein
MTFSLPVELAALFTRRVPSRDRSRYLAEALAERLGERDRKLAESCEIANRDSSVIEIEREFDAFDDPIAEPPFAEAWKGPRMRPNAKKG